MDETGIRELLTALKCQRIKTSGDHVLSSCPLAPYTHQKKTDRHPSFGVQISMDRPSCYHCFSCGAKGTILGLLRELETHGIIVPQALFDRVRTLEGTDPRERRNRYRDFFGKDILPGLKEVQDTVFDEEVLKSFSGRVHKYILDRHVSLDTCKRWEIGYDPEKRRVIFPVRRRKDSALVGAMGRTILPDGEPKYLTYFNFKKSHFLYGEHLLKKVGEATLGEVMDYELPGQEGVIVVEGLMDVLRLHSMGYENVVGVMTSTLSAKQIEKLKTTGRDVYLMLDWDLAGIQGRISSAPSLVDKVHLYDVPGITVCERCGFRWSHVGSVSGRKTQLCSGCGEPWKLDMNKKDPDGLTDEEILDCLKSAERIKRKT